MYAKFFKRVLDLFLSLCALVCLSPLLIVLTLVGAVAMKGNPFFTQQRPGLHEKIFRLIKFRTMTNEKDKDGNFLPDTVRLNKYGRFLRSTSLDELPELINIFKGDMSIVGPRPLAVKYLPFYTEEERKRHSILPGLTGLAQVNGRNDLSWEDKFRFDLQYAADISFVNDVKIVFLTVRKVFMHEGIGQGGEAPVSLHIQRAKMMQNKEDK
ncbi:sugar transferase [bacterium]|nr:sugar transferase [bacterium]MBP5435188.1 sugar transferase [bacterium]